MDPTTNPPNPNHSSMPSEPPPPPPPITTPPSTNNPPSQTPTLDKPDPLAGTSFTITSVEEPSKSSSQPNTIPSTTPIAPPLEPPATNGPGLKLIISILLGLLILAASLFVGLSLADAYRSLPFTHPITRQVGNVLILSLPILPKTPEQVVQASIVAHSKVSSAHFNASLATSSKSLVSVLGSENFDMVIEGDVDWVDVEKPRTALSLNISNQFSGNLSYLDEALYFKITTLPQGILGMLAGLTGAELSAFDPLLNQWVKIDQKALESEARDLLNESQPETQETPFDEAYRQTLNALYEEDILPNLTMTSDTKDGTAVHHLNLKLTGDSINRVVQKLSEDSPQASSLHYTLDSDKVLPSDVIKDITIDLYINKADYFLNNLSISTTVDNQAILKEYSSDSAPFALDHETYRIAFALSLKDIGNIQPIVAPAGAMSLDEFTAKVTSIMTPAGYETTGASSLSPSSQFAISRDAQRRSDLNALLNAIYLYATDNNGSFPPGISSDPQDAGTNGLNLANYLVPEYLARIPQDPSAGTASVTEYTIHLGKNGKLVGSAQSETTGETIEVSR